MNPYHYSVFHETSGYLAFAKQKDKKLQGILVTHVDNPIDSLADLIDVDDKTFAFPSPAAFAASILSSSQLNKLQIPFKAEYLSSHDNVYTSVKHKLYLVGGGIHRTLQKSTPAVRQDLKVIWESEEYTPHAFAALKSVKQDVINELTNALVNMFYDKEGRKMLLKIGFNQGIEAAYDKQWDDVRALKLETLQLN
jgi:phosphonate transport system substrate-binding protein